MYDKVPENSFSTQRMFGKQHNLFAENTIELPIAVKIFRVHLLRDYCRMDWNSLAFFSKLKP